MGGVVQRAADEGIPVLVVAGDIAADLALPVRVSTVSLVERFGAERAWADTEECIARAVAEALDTTDGNDRSFRSVPDTRKKGD